MADRTTKTPIGEIDDFSIEVNGIIVPIKVLVMEATQYQALVGNDWLSKTNTTLDWNTQKLQLSQNATCGHFKTPNTPVPLIEFKKEEKKSIWEVYQVLWADKNHNKLPPTPPRDKQSNNWMDVHTTITKFGKWHSPKSKEHRQKK
ncbi:hypothetical protein G9A89_007096 [Geosiphon pyriformis]|nr:hypothetical protein G9A89_007096 [Geosiphon pyriformis]